MKKYWRYWCHAIGKKTGNTDIEADIIALIRTIIILQYLTTNTFIIAGIIRHW